MNKVKMFRILGIIFSILTFIGAGVVFFNKGEVNPGIAVIPSLIAVIFTNLSNEEKKKDK